MKYQIKTITMKESAKLQYEIQRAKKKLIKKAQEVGIWENFGQDEVRELEAKYDDLSLRYGTPQQRAMSDSIRAFDNWCMNFDNSDLRQAKQKS